MESFLTQIYIAVPSRKEFSEKELSLLECKIW